MYIPVKWKDHIVQFMRRFMMTNGEGPGLVYLTPSPGEIEQQGTPQSARNFGHMDLGILEGQLVANLMFTTGRQQAGVIESLTGQQFDVTLSNSRKYPATNAIATVALTKYLNNTDYQLHYKILECSGGYVESVEFYYLASNAFKVKYTGSATSAKLRIYVTGGM